MAQDDSTQKRTRLREMGLTENDARKILDYSVSRSAAKDIAGSHVPFEKFDGVQRFLEAMGDVVRRELLP